MQLRRDLDLLYEIGSLRHVDRTWNRFFSGGAANNAEHSFRVAWTALLIAAYEGATNTDKILKMALVHDLAETRTGDVDYLSRQYVVRNDELGLADIAGGTTLEHEMKALAAEYARRESIEAKIVKDADNLDVDLELREQAVRGHDVAASAEWQEVRQYVRAERMYTATGKRLAEAIPASNPHSWHLYSERNRRNGGDWQNRPAQPSR